MCHGEHPAVHCWCCGYCSGSASSQPTVTPVSKGCMCLLPQHLTLYVAVQAVTVMQKRQQTAGFCELMRNQLMAYRSSVKPFSLACNLSTDPVVWWRSVAAGNAAAAGAVLLLVELLYGFTPHAAEPERLFSLLSFFDSPKRSRLSAKRLEMMVTAVAYHHRELAQLRSECCSTVPAFFQPKMHLSGASASINRVHVIAECSSAWSAVWQPACKWVSSCSSGSAVCCQGAGRCPC